MDKLAVLLLFLIRFCYGISCKAACRHTPITHAQLLYVSTGVRHKAGIPRAASTVWSCSTPTPDKNMTRNAVRYLSLSLVEPYESCQSKTSHQPEQGDRQAPSPLAVIAKGATIRVRVHGVPDAKTLGHRLLPGVLPTQTHGGL